MTFWQSKQSLFSENTMDLKSFMTTLQTVHSASLIVVLICWAIVEFSDPSSTSKDPCNVTDIKPMWITGTTAVLISLFMYLPYVHVSAFLKKPTAEIPRPRISRTVYILYMIYTFGVFLCAFMCIPSFYLGFQVNVTRIACLSVIPQIVLVAIPLVFALGVIYMLYHLHGELSASVVTAPAIAAS